MHEDACRMSLDSLPALSEGRIRTPRELTKASNTVGLVMNILKSLRPNISAHEDTCRRGPSANSAICEDSNLRAGLRAFMRWRASALTRWNASARPASAANILYSMCPNILRRLRANVKFPADRRQTSE